MMVDSPYFHHRKYISRPKHTWYEQHFFTFKRCCSYISYPN